MFISVLAIFSVIYHSVSLFYFSFLNGPLLLYCYTFDSKWKKKGICFSPHFLSLVFFSGLKTSACVKDHGVDTTETITNL